MTLALEALFALLVAADTFYTYKAIKSGKAKEAAWCKRYIGNVPLTVILTIVGAVLIILLAIEGGFYWPMAIVCPIYGYGVVRAWRILHGR
jgi:heme/copper-type cytochrome/quinol oxidase subunit 2